MKKQLLITLGLSLSCTMFTHAQTKTDSIAGTYAADYNPAVDTTSNAPTMSSPYVWSWYQPYRKHEELLLEPNHCAALTVNESGGPVIYLDGNPYTYYGIWRTSGDTVTITYSRSYSMNEYIVYVEEPSSCNAADTSHSISAQPAQAPIRKLSPVVIEKYIWHDDEILSPLVSNGMGDFTKKISLTSLFFNVYYIP